jgi:hypothetical protein
MEDRMFIHPAFNVFLAVQSDASPPASAVDHVIDWRWLIAPEADATLPSERSLIDWPAWARPKTQRHA